MTVMSEPSVRTHWTLEDIDWAAFRADKVDPDLLTIAKTAALVELNSRDYVAYLRNIFGADADLMADIVRWGEEEAQHGRALGRWAQLADPAFNLDEAAARFNALYRLPLDLDHSVRGSPAGELLARCVVESGTSSFYSAIRDQTDEPVLKAIAGHIAADEFRHYKLFYDRKGAYAAIERPGLWSQILVALGRVKETDDDELASAYYAANVVDGAPYDRRVHARAYERVTLKVYRRRHIERGFAMIAKALGLAPHGLTVRLAAGAFWGLLRFRDRQNALAA